MLLFAKSAPPHPIRGFRQPALDQAIEGPVTLITSPAGYLLTESLAATLAESSRSTLWLRLGREDRDPATFLLSFITALQRLCPGAGVAILERMRRQPGPICGWQSLFTELGRQLADTLPASSAIVLENLHHLNDPHPTLGLIGLYLLPMLPPSISCILTSHSAVRPATLPARTIHRGVNDLQLNPRTARALVEHAQADLPPNLIHRVIDLSGGRAVVLLSIALACGGLGRELVMRVVAAAHAGDDLLARIASAWLPVTHPDATESLVLSLRLGYSYPALEEAACGHGRAGPDPWLQPLAEGMARVREVWREPLSAALNPSTRIKAAALRSAGDFLSRQGSIEQAVPLYLELGDNTKAAEVIAGAVDRMMNLGQWETLSEWLSQLPLPVVKTYPSLIYSYGEIAAAQGKVSDARRAFASAAEMFLARQEADGACQSLLAESALAGRRGDHAYAEMRALAARAVAEAANLHWHMCWTEWQLGCLDSVNGRLDEALDHFNQASTAAAALNDPPVLDLVSQVKGLIERQCDLRRQREYHRQEYFVAEGAENATAAKLAELIDGPLQNLESLLGIHGWSRTPLMIKLHVPTSLEKIPGVPDSANLWTFLLSALRIRRRSSGPVLDTRASRALDPPDVPLITLPADIKISLPIPSVLPLTFIPPKSQSTQEAPLAEPVLTVTQVPSTKIDLFDPPDTDVATVKVPTLMGYLLGTFRVALNDTLIESWPSIRGRTLCRYLLTHRDKPAPREVLMELMWPDARPEAARNRLNVAMHGLRQALRAASEVPVILFQENAYIINPELQVWLDADEFDRHVRLGRQLEAEGHIASATAEYERATGLYQGDFMADDLYEDWAVLTRERLRSDYLDTLDRLCRVHFNQGQYAICTTLCQSILSTDNCREDAHRLLMRCQSRMGQSYLALRQYQLCVEALRKELDVPPASGTTQLYELIHHGERV